MTVNLDLPEKRAYAAQWLIEKRLERIRERMPPDVFIAWAEALDLLLAPLETVAKYGDKPK